MKNCVSVNEFVQTVLRNINSILEVKIGLVLPPYKTDIDKKKNYRETGEGIGIKNIKGFVDIKPDILKTTTVIHELLSTLKQFCEDAQLLNEQAKVDAKKTKIVSFHKVACIL